MNIYPIADPSQQENCTASPKTTSGKRQPTMSSFHLYVTPDTFARYGAKVAHGLLDEIILGVGSVAGFYSEWSPSISTRDVKVLTNFSEEQNITLPAGYEFEPPRLGHVDKANLYINRPLEFRKREPEPNAVEETPDVGTERAVPAAQVPTAMDPRMLQMLVSL